MQHVSVNPYIVSLNTEMFKNSIVPAGQERLKKVISSGKDNESPITIKFVRAYKSNIYKKYAHNRDDEAPDECQCVCLLFLLFTVLFQKQTTYTFG